MATERTPAEVWWSAAGMRAPFTPGKHGGNNDGKVRDADGRIVADCFGWESRADVIADLLNRFAAEQEGAE